MVIFIIQQGRDGWQFASPLEFQFDQEAIVAYALQHTKNQKGFRKILHFQVKEIKKMNCDFNELTTKLIRLPKKDRLEIVRFLLFLDDRSEEIDDVESAWEEEITDRVRAVEEESAIGVDFEKALQEIGKRFSL